MKGVQVIVVAKRPVAGRVKTRLTPPYRPEQAAALAHAALADTLDAVARTRAVRRVLALEDFADREPQRASIPGRRERPGGDAGRTGAAVSFDVIAQRGGGLDERLAYAFADAYAGCRTPMVLIGMDTPQVTPALLEAAADALGAADAVLGLAGDGGFWLLGLRRPDPDLLLGVPMSTVHTGAVQRARLLHAGLRLAEVPRLRDVDTAEDAAAVAAHAPHSTFAKTHARLAGSLPATRAGHTGGATASTPAGGAVMRGAAGVSARGGGAL